MNTRAKRHIVTAAAGTVLLGAGAGIGVALTGGASADTGSAQADASPAAPAAGASGAAAGRCADALAQLSASNHPQAAARLAALCGRPLIRLALVGGEHGEVTFAHGAGGAAGPVTVAFDRGTAQVASPTGLTVRAADGTTWSWAVSAGTVIRRDGQKVAGSALATGDSVLVEGTVASDGSRQALLVRIRGNG